MNIDLLSLLIGSAITLLSTLLAHWLQWSAQEQKEKKQEQEKIKDLFEKLFSSCLFPRLTPLQKPVISNVR